MDDLGGTGRPLAASSAAPPDLPGEAEDLAALYGTVPLAPRVWIPAAAEAAFYRLNQLPSRLAELFASVASHDPDEDDIEELAPRARSLVAGHALLDAWVDAFYDETSVLGERLRVRRLGASGREAARGRPALLAVRAVWAEAWSDRAIVARLRASGSVAIEPAPTLVHAGNDGPAADDVRALVASVLGEPKEVAALPDGSVTRVGPAARSDAARR